MLILFNDDQSVITRAETPLDRLMARARAATLDRALAGGVPPEASAALALRAQALVRPSTRDALAHCVERLVEEAHHGHRPCTASARVPARRSAVIEATDLLQVLTAALRASAPVAARGVAQVNVLLTDGAGPLYCHGCDLRPFVLEALYELAPLGAEWGDGDA